MILIKPIYLVFNYLCYLKYSIKSSNNFRITTKTDEKDEKSAFESIPIAMWIVIIGLLAIITIGGFCAY